MMMMMMMNKSMADEEGVDYNEPIALHEDAGMPIK
jgi:hypothetical protein